MANKSPVVGCVDDDEAMLSTVVRCLKRESFDIRSTLSASEALGWIASDDISVLVSDYDMPEMTGASLAPRDGAHFAHRQAHARDCDRWHQPGRDLPVPQQAI